jgi:hypothetical protein
MRLKLACFAAGVCLLAAVISCGKNSPAPVSPTGSAQSSSNAAPDGSTVKAGAPVPQAPPNGSKPDQVDGIVLVVSNPSLKYGNAPLSLHFQVTNAAGAVVADTADIPAGAGTTSYTVSPVLLEADQTYSWKARVETGGQPGPWSAVWTFIAPQNDGYIRGSELYDPLINGKTVGSPTGPMTFIPGVGLRFHSQLSFVAYVLPQTLTEGEFSLIVTDMNANTDGGKTKLFAMGEGFDDIVTNNRRMTVEKRGDPAGIVAWRFITHDDQVDTEGPERVFVNFKASNTYFWQATWRANRFEVLIRDGGVDGVQIYRIGKNFEGRAYDPVPHVVYLGAPVGRSGEAGASVDNVTYRQIWVSGRPRPAFAK